MIDKQSMGRTKLVCAGSMVSLLCVGVFALGQIRDTGLASGPPDYNLSWHTVDGGGVMRSISDDGAYELSGTIGQPDASGAMMGSGESAYGLTSGFWFPVVPGDADGDGGITLHDYERFESCMSGDGVHLPADCASFDSDRDLDVDIRDFEDFQRGFNGS